jgi:2-polyprenyl-3-methyl-5-hydroxy-6-metoxy-1,4-benzoquinol methylase
MQQKTFQEEVKSGNRFEFGKNWTSFLSVLNEERIQNAQDDMLKILDEYDLKGKSFLDIGSGSGLSSLVAKRLGAKVTSFDYDPLSVSCTQELKRRYYSEDNEWNIMTGSALDESFLRGLGQFDMVYSWGVLHHTGNMWKTFELIYPMVKEGGGLFIAIYNDEKEISVFWTKVKKFYCSGWFGMLITKIIFYPVFVLLTFTYDILSIKNPFSRIIDYKKKRGMSFFHDIEDWLGGYPFEVATPDIILQFFRKKGFELINLKTTNKMGCNEFLFLKK